MQLWQDYNFQHASFDDRLAILRAELKRKGIEATTAQIEQDLKRLAIPEAKASARFYNSLGSTVPFMNNATQWLRILGGLVR